MKVKINSHGIDIHKLHYHDGQLLHYEEIFSTEELKKSVIKITVALCVDYSTYARDVYQFIYRDVIRALKTQDFSEHEFHMRAGNISNGYIRHDGVSLFYLCDGMIEIQAKQIEIVKKHSELNSNHSSVYT